MRILLMGATGFLGGHVLKRLVIEGHRIRVLVRPESRSRISAVTKGTGVEIISGELENSALVQKTTLGTDAVYHLALIYGPGRTFGIREERANCRATEALVHAAVKAGVARFVFASSVVAYGWYHPPSTWPLDENAPLSGRSAYSRSKIQSERIVRDACERGSVQHAILRLCPIYGPGVPRYERFFASLRAWPGYCVNPLRVVIPGLEHAGVSHWIHVSDAVRCVLDAGVSRNRLGVINVAGPRAATRQELLALAHHVEAPRTPVLRIYNTGRAQEMLGFTPKVQLSEGIKELLDADCSTS